MKNTNLLKKFAEKTKNRMMGKFSKNTSFIKIIEIDEDFKIKAKQAMIVSENNKSYNPIKLLMNEDTLMRLDSNAKERYLLETVEKYLKVKKIFESENSFCG